MQIEKNVGYTTVENFKAGAGNKNRKMRKTQQLWKKL